MTTDAAGPGVLLYDTRCALCTRFARAAGFLSRRGLVVLGIDAGITKGLLPGFDDERAWATMHHVAPDGTVRSGPAGVAPVVQTWPGGPLAIAALRRVPGMRRANELLYHWLAGSRPAACKDGHVRRERHDENP